MTSKLDIKRALKEHGFTVASISEKMGVSSPSVTSYIRGNPSVESLYKLADAIGCDIRDLFFSPDDTAPTTDMPTTTLPSVHFCPHCGTKFQILQ